MDQNQREYELEMARDMDDGERTPEQQSLVRKASHAIVLDVELRETINERRTAGIDTRLVLSHQIYEGQRDPSGRETFQAGVELPRSTSRVYFNIARQITNDGSAQLGDLLFPSDDRNYGLNPAPLAKPPLAVLQQPAVDSKGEPLVDAEGNALTNMQAHTRRMAKVAAKTERMFTKVDAALIAARYPSKARKCIKMAAIYGTGILKGPVPKMDTRGRWAKKSGGNYSLKKGEDLHPDVQVVHPMDFFPDLSGSSLEESSFAWERSYMVPAELSRSVRTVGFDKDAVDTLLASGKPNELTGADDPREEAKTGQTGKKLSDGRFCVWERHGSLSKQMLKDFDVTPPNAEDDYFEAIVYFCQGEVLKVKVLPYEDDDLLYSVFTWDEDPLSVFGYGVPWLIQDPQATYVAAWRMALDNGGLSAAPQVVIDRKLVDPVDNVWELRGGKLWYRTGENYANESQNKPFEVFHITQNLNELWAMMDRAVDDAYEMSGVTRVEKAQGGLDNAPVTLGATQIMQNNTTVSRRALARRWDDDVTLGLVRRMYDYFMQFDADDDIKANMVVEPRGASVLLAKELQATNYMQLYQMTSGGQAEGIKAIPLLRAIAGVMQVPEGKFIETEDETTQRQQTEAESEGQEDPAYVLETRKVEVEEAKIELDQARVRLEYLKEEWAKDIKTAELQLKELVASSSMDDRAQDRAARYQTSLESIAAKHDGEFRKFALGESSKRDIKAAEIAAKQPSEQLKAAAAAKQADTKERELEYKLTTGNDGV